MPGSASLYKTHAAGTGQTDDSEYARAKVLQKLLADVQISQQLIQRFRQIVYNEPDPLHQNTKSDSHIKDQANSTAHSKRISQIKKQKQFLLQSREITKNLLSSTNEHKKSERASASPQRLAPIFAKKQPNSKQPTSRKILDCQPQTEVKRVKLKKEASGITVESSKLFHTKLAPETSSFGSLQRDEQVRKVEVNHMRVYGQTTTSLKPRILTSVLSQSRRGRAQQVWNINTQSGPSLNTDINFSKERARTPGVDSIHARRKFLLKRHEISSNSRERLLSGRPTNIESTQHFPYQTNMSAVPQFTTFQLPQQQIPIQLKREELSFQSQAAKQTITIAKAEKVHKQPSIAHMPKHMVAANSVGLKIRKGSQSSIVKTLHFDDASSVQRASAKHSQDSVTRRLQNATLSQVDLVNAMQMSSQQLSKRSRSKSTKSHEEHKTKAPKSSQKQVICSTMEEQIALQRTLYVVPKMLRHEQEVGNSNNQPLELLKPKWVTRVDIDKAKDSDGKIIAPSVVSLIEPNIDASHLAILMATACFKFTHISNFQRPSTASIKRMNKCFNKEHFIFGKHAAEHTNSIKNDLVSTILKERKRVILDGFEHNQFFAANRVVKTKIIRRSTRSLPTPPDVAVVFPRTQEVHNDPVDIWRFENDEIDAQLELFNDVSSLLENEWIQQPVPIQKPKINPATLTNFENQQKNLITNPSVLHLAYLSLTLMQRFTINYYRHVQLRQLNFLVNSKLFFQPRIFIQDVVLRLPWFAFLNPLPLKTIYRDRSGQDKETVYKTARAATLELKQQAQQMGISAEMVFEYPQELARKHKVNNETFEMVENLGHHNEAKRLCFSNCFASHLPQLHPHALAYAEQLKRLNRTQRPIVVKLPEQFRTSFTAQLMDKEQQARLLQDYINLAFKDHKLRQWQSLDDIGQIPDHWNNLLYAKNLHKTSFLYKVTHNQSKLAQELWVLNLTPIFGGKDRSIDALFQLRRKDWKLQGKHICGQIRQRASESDPLPINQKLSKSKFIREHLRKIEKMSRLFTWVDPDLSSDLFATSFYKTDIESRDNLKFEIVTVKSPLINSNPVEAWMRVPFFQELLTDHYRQRFAQVQEELKHWQTAHEFRNLVKIEEQLQVSSTEQEYVRLVQEIYCKNMHFSEYDKLHQEDQSNESESQNLETMSQQVNYNAQNERVLIEVENAEANLQTQMLRRNSKLVYGKSLRQSMQVNRASTLKEVFTFNPPSVKITQRSSSPTEQQMDSSKTSSVENYRLKDYSDLQTRFVRFVDTHYVNTLTGKAHLPAKLIAVESNAYLQPRSRMSDDIIQHQYNILSASQLSGSEYDRRSSESSQSETESVAKMKETYRRSLKNPNHLTFAHLSPEQQVADKDDMYNQWLATSGQNLTYSVDEAVKLRKQQAFNSQEMLSSSESEQPISEVLDDESVRSSNSINSQSFKPPLIVRIKTGDLNYGVRLSDGTLSQPSDPSKPQQVEESSKQDEVAAEDAIKLEKLQSYLTQLAQSNEKDQFVAEYFKSQLEKSFFSAVRSNNVESAINYLIRFGVNLETKDELSNTALNTAAQAGFSQLALQLLQMGADKKNPNVEGNPALFFDPTL